MSGYTLDCSVFITRFVSSSENCLLLATVILRVCRRSPFTMVCFKPSTYFHIPSFIAAWSITHLQDFSFFTVLLVTTLYQLRWSDIWPILPCPPNLSFRTFPVGSLQRFVAFTPLLGYHIRSPRYMVAPASFSVFHRPRSCSTFCYP